MMHRWRRLVAVSLAIVLVGMTSLAGAQEGLHPFTARYKVRFYGLSGGVLILTLRHGDRPNEYVYESRAEPSFLGSFMISRQARESSDFLVDGNTVKPLKFLSDDGKQGDEKDSNITFDWEQNKLVGRSERVDFDQPIPANIQDHLSIQMAVVLALKQGRSLGEYALIDTGEIKHYTYVEEGPATIDYKNRPLQTIVVSSERTGEHGGRINRYWHAPSLGDLPVRAERSRDGKIDLTMDLQSVQFAD